MNRGIVTGHRTVPMCPIQDCRVELRPGLIMCGGHWKVLPAKVRVAYQQQRRTNPKQAAAAAIASVRARLGSAK